MGILNVGGLMGTNDGTIENCYSESSVDAAMLAGGLAGTNRRTIDKCYSNGVVTTTGSDIGGLLGYNYDDEVTIGEVTACFWDTETSDQASSAGGDGKTTAEMQNPNTFTDAGWDPNIWGFVAGGYPGLAWERQAWFPSPADGATDVNVNTALSWSPGYAAVTHDVYFGTSFNDVNQATTSSPEYKVNQSGTTYSPSTMDTSTSYYWRIDEVEATAIITGTVWSFTTAALEMIAPRVKFARKPLLATQTTR